LGASGSSNTYQWQLNTANGWVNLTNGAVYSGVNTATLNLTNLTMPLSGYQFRCLLSSSGCPSSVSTSATATLTVQALPTLTGQPTATAICVGSGTSFSVAASGTGLTYQWQVNSGAGFVTVSNGGMYSGATTPILSIVGATVSLNNNQYRCVVNGACPPALISNAVVLTVHGPATVGSSPVSLEICSGSSATFKVSGISVPPINYQWQYLSPILGSVWTDTSGAILDSLVLLNVSVGVSGYQYRCLLSNGTCPAQAASAAATLTVRLQPTISLAASPLTGLLPGQQTVLTATPNPSASTGGSYSYVWSLNGSPITVSGNSLTIGITQTGAYQASVRESWPSGLECTASSSVVNIVALASSRLFIFPSPNDGRFTVSYYNSGGAVGQRTIRIYNGIGALVYDRAFPISGSYTLIPIDLQRMSRGIYYVVVGDGSGERLADGKVHVR